MALPVLMPKAVAELMEEIAGVHGLKLELVLARGSVGWRQADRVRCRADIALALKSKGKNYGQIARWFRCHPSSVYYLVNTYGAGTGTRKGAEPTRGRVPDGPDLSGEWAI